MMGSLSRQGSAMISNILALVGSEEESRAGSAFAGVWRVQDSQGHPFEIALSEDGIASANRAGEGMNGTWIDDGASAVITWDTGWTTKITRTGDGFVKTAYDTASATPENTSAAERVSGERAATRPN